MSAILTFVALAFGAAFVVALHHGHLIMSMDDGSFGGRSDRQRKYWKSSNQEKKKEKKKSLPLMTNVYVSFGLSSSSSPSSSSSSKRQQQYYNYDWDASTEDNYHQSSNDHRFVGKYADIRATLDYSYHKHYTIERQLLQDEIIDSLLKETRVMDERYGNTTTTTITTTITTTTTCQAPIRPWLVLTAGAMGAGKSFTVRQLAKRGLFPLESFVVIDADQARRLLPEWNGYVQRDPERAGEHTRKEAGYIVELLTEAALRRGQNVLVDGTLKDARWYQAHLDQLRRSYPNLRTCILHVTAPREAILERAMNRANATGRVVPYEVLVHAMEQVPKSVDKLRSCVDLVIDLYNAPNSSEVEIITKGVDWDTFRKTWTQNCPR